MDILDRKISTTDNGLLLEVKDILESHEALVVDLDELKKHCTSLITLQINEKNVYEFDSEGTVIFEFDEIDPKDNIEFYCSLDTLSNTQQILFPSAFAVPENIISIDTSVLEKNVTLLSAAAENSMLCSFRLCSNIKTNRRL